MAVSWIVKTSVALLIFVIGLGALAASLVWVGVYNFAAVEPHSKIVQWLVVSTKRQSIARHSNDIKAPLLSDFNWVKVGAQHYDASCVFCHGAPGREAGEFSKGLNPPAPELRRTEVQKKYTDAELYWIIKNGIRMTGMPAFGPMHNEKELWAIVAFIRRLPEMQAEDYRVVTRTGGQKPPSEKHH
jgi:mono/diheme cytochrome c family protein